MKDLPPSIPSQSDLPQAKLFTYHDRLFNLYTRAKKRRRGLIPATY